MRTSAAALIAALVLVACVTESSFTAIDDHACPPDGTDLTYDNFGRAFLDTYCQTCHATDARNRNGAPTMFTFDTPDDVINHADRIYARAAGANVTMPPGPDDPPRAERDLLAEWLACPPGLRSTPQIP